MSRLASPQLQALLQALLVTFLWSTSWVLIKIGLEDIPALTFAGLRYALAFVCLIILTLMRKRFQHLRSLKPNAWARLFLLGLLFFAVTQGAQFLGLAYLPAATVNLLLSLTTIVVALMGIPLLAEKPSALQWTGITITLFGAWIYFHPVSVPAAEVIGFTAVLVGVVANAASSILGREINRARDLDPLLVTTVSMGFGAVILLVAGIRIQGLPPIGVVNWVIIGWLALVNTAFAFTLWNHTLRTLSAMESSIINNTMLIQIPLLAVIFLGENITLLEGIGLLVAGFGTVMVSLQPVRVDDGR